MLLYFLGRDALLLFFIYFRACSQVLGCDAGFLSFWFWDFCDSYVAGFVLLVFGIFVIVMLLVLCFRMITGCCHEACYRSGTF